MKINGIFMIGIISIKILGFLSCNDKQENKRFEINKIDKNVVTKIEISKVDFDMTSIIHIDCDMYEEHFNTMKSRYIIEDKDSINLLINIISILQKDTFNYDFNNEPDVRAKLLIYHQNNKIDSLCMDNGRIMLNGELYLSNKRLAKLVKNL
jgi:hypothetical protein